MVTYRQIEEKEQLLLGEIAEKQRELESLKKIKPLVKLKPTVSDHALIRYMERVLGFDIEKLREEILTPDIEAAINFGAAKVKIKGIEFRISQKTITTVVV